MKKTILTIFVLFLLTGTFSAAVWQHNANTSKPPSITDITDEHEKDPAESTPTGGDATEELNPPTTPEITPPAPPPPPAVIVPPAPPPAPKPPKYIALTFDDGPSAHTAQILDSLAAHDAVATFFVVGSRTASYPELIQRIDTEGSEIGNHSFSHKNFTKLTSTELKSQVSRTNAAVEKLIGKKPSLLRPTYGAVNHSVQKNAGMILVNWSVDTNDWKDRDAEIVAKRVLEQAKDGDIILMHDLYQSTADALDIFLPKLKEEGFVMLTVSQLFEQMKVTPSVGSLYLSGKQV